MDEIWQRHKTFIVQVAVGAIVLLIVLLVKSSMYDGPDDPASLEKKNDTALKEIRSAPGPDQQSIDEQERTAKLAEEQIRSLASEIASLESGDAYVRENITRICALIEQGDRVDEFFSLYTQLPQTALSSLQGEIRTYFVGKAAQSGVELDERVGLTSGFQEDEVPLGIHGLAIVADVYRRALANPDIEGVQDVAITKSAPRARAGAQSNVSTSRLKSFRIKLTLLGFPSGVQQVVSSFNTRAGGADRNVVLDDIVVKRVREEEDQVRADMSIAGVQYLVAAGQEGDSE